VFFFFVCPDRHYECNLQRSERRLPFFDFFTHKKKKKYEIGTGNTCFCFLVFFCLGVRPLHLFLTFFSFELSEKESEADDISRHKI